MADVGAWMPRVRDRIRQLMIVASTAGCDHALHWRGVVRDPTGAPVVDARVTLSCRHQRERTDDDGSFSLSVMGGIPRPCELQVVTADGGLAWHGPVDPH